MIYSLQDFAAIGKLFFLCSHTKHKNPPLFRNAAFIKSQDIFPPGGLACSEFK
jgi:hypothetical protein